MKPKLDISISKCLSVTQRHLVVCVTAPLALHNAYILSPQFSDKPFPLVITQKILRFSLTAAQKIIDKTMELPLRRDTVFLMPRYCSAVTPQVSFTVAVMYTNDKYFMRTPACKHIS